MAHLFSIGRFARLSGLTVKALRFYAAQGLLRPEVVDPETGYRYYVYAQVGQAERIRELRALELPLDRIEAVLLGQLELGAALELHQQDLERQILHRSLLRDRVRSALEHGQPSGYILEHRQIPQHPVLVGRYRTSLTHCERDRRAACLELCAALERQGAGLAAAPYAYHPRSPGGFDPDDYAVVLCLPCDPALPSSEPGWGGAVLMVRHLGDYTRLQQAYTALYSGLERAGLERAGPTCERYLHGLLDPDTPPHTEVWCALKEPPP